MAKEQAGKAKNLRDEFPGSIPLTGGTGDMYKWDTPGQTLRGRFLRLREGSMGGQLVNLDNGTDIVTASAPQTLADALDGVKAGTEIVIRYIGEAQPKKAGGRPYKQFEVVALAPSSR
jgi:hypothetical protein